MIYITGDTHGGFQRFGNKYFPPQKHMSREDYVIITGDFGGLWDGGPKDWYWLDWLSGKPFTTLFVDGNHENFDLLNALPEKYLPSINPTIAIKDASPEVEALIRAGILSPEVLADNTQHLSREQAAAVFVRMICPEKRLVEFESV